MKQYYCDVDVGHLISFNEDLAHRLVTEPAEIIPLVSLPETMEHKFSNFRSVRKRIKEMHSSHCLPLYERHRNPRASTPPPLLRGRHLHSKSRCPHNLTTRSSTRNRHWRFSPLLQSNCTPHPMPKLPSLESFASGWRLHGCLASQGLRQTKNARRFSMPYGSICCGSREMPIR
jgi:hypothetical protein